MTAPPVILLVVSVSLLPGVGSAQSTVDPVKPYAWSANAGWLDFRAGGAFGAVVEDGWLSGRVWSANAGWISLGGSPADGMHYGNIVSADCGVNFDARGDLNGWAWGANIGWINFGWAAAEDANRARLDLCTGEFSGWVWSANCGWIGLGGLLRTASLRITDTDDDGISDAWELSRTGTLTILSAGADTDGDGVSDADEYLADTNPLDPASRFEILDYRRLPGFGFGLEMSSITWQSSAARHYRILSGTDLDQSSWQLYPAVWAGNGGAVSALVNFFPAPRRFIQVQPFRPLAP